MSGRKCAPPVALNPDFIIPSHIAQMVAEGIGTYTDMITERIETLDEPIDRAGFEGFLSLYTSGGKALRGTLVAAGYGMWHNAEQDGPPSKDIPMLGAGFVELIHAYLLAFDDVTDGATERRGRDAAHILTGKLIGNLAVGSQVSEEDRKAAGVQLTYYAALSAKHWAEAHFVERVLQNGLPPERLGTVISILHRTLGDTGAGQIMDVNGAVFPQLATRDRAVAVALAKTAYYSIQLPLQLGGALAGAPREELDTVVSYAINTGLAFQLRDDVLGTFGDPAVTGKPPNDIPEGKRTLLVVTALEKANALQSETLHAALGNRQLSAPALEQCRRIIRTTGALRRVTKETKEYARQARQALRELPEHIPAAYREFLGSLAVYSALRDY